MMKKRVWNMVGQSFQCGSPWEHRGCMSMGLSLGLKNLSSRRKPPISPEGTNGAWEKITGIKEYSRVRTVWIRWNASVCSVSTNSSVRWSWVNTCKLAPLRWRKVSGSCPIHPCLCTAVISVQQQVYIEYLSIEDHIKTWKFTDQLRGRPIEELVHTGKWTRGYTQDGNERQRKMNTFSLRWSVRGMCQNETFTRGICPRGKFNTRRLQGEEILLR